MATTPHVIVITLNIISDDNTAYNEVMNHLEDELDKLLNDEPFEVIDAQIRQLDNLPVLH